MSPGLFTFLFCFYYSERHKTHTPTLERNRTGCKPLFLCYLWDLFGFASPVGGLTREFGWKTEEIFFGEGDLRYGRELLRG